MKRLTLAHVSDLHLPFVPELSARQRLSKRQLSAFSWRRRAALHRREIVDALVQDLRAEAVDHVVITGDITNFSLPGEFRQAAQWLAALAPAGGISIVPGNHDALVAVPAGQGLELWHKWTHAEDGWPSLHRLGEIALIGLNSALPTPPLLARGRLGAEQLSRLEKMLVAEGEEGRVRIVALHHPPADAAVAWRKALADRAALRAVLLRAGAELVLHGHARDARLDALAGPREPIPCLCVPSSSALPNPSDQGARWHRLRLSAGGEAAPSINPAPRIEVAMRRWSIEAHAFVDDGTFELCLPGDARRSSGDNDTH